MRLSLLLCWCFLLSVVLPAQPKPELLAETVEEFTVDRVQQLYLRYADGRLEKRDAASGQVYTFYDQLLGEVTSLDVSDPFGTLVFYEDYQIVLLLDRTLNEVARLDLRDIESVQQVTAIARNLADQLWVYDEWDYRLKLVNQRGEIVQQSDNLRLLLDREDPPLSLWTQNNTLFALWPDGELLNFSLWAQLRGRQRLPAAERYVWTTSGLIGHSRGKDWRWTGTEARPLQRPESVPAEDYFLPWAGGNLYLSNKRLLFLK